MIERGQWVRFTGSYTFCGIETHGTIGIVADVRPVPADIVPGDVLASVSPFFGWYADGSEAFGIVIPLPACQCVPVAPPTKRPPSSVEITASD